MSLTKTPICDFGKKAETFQLKSTDNKIISLNDIKGDKGTLIMFICNHCPYVKAVIEDIVEDANKLAGFGIKSESTISTPFVFQETNKKTLPACSIVYIYLPSECECASCFFVSS